LAVNSGAISDTLIESELFGYVKGAFTGATKNQDGLFVAAGRGTIFLDEIEAMSPRMQAALLRVLEEREIRPVGSSKPRPIQARVIVASNQALEEAIAAKRFRSDLYFRISRLHLHIPALRERKEDIPLLAESFLHKAYGERSFRVTDGLARAMKRHAWPGNVRELKNKVELMALLAGDATDLTEEMFTPHAMLAAAAKAPEILSVVPSRPIKAQGMPAAPLAQRTGRYASVRFEKMRALFNEHKKLTRAEIVRLLGCAPGTAANDLRVLEADGVIHRVCTTVSQRTSYFVLRDDKE
jgi:transcriptional regulator with PAS, ATPase and Fis domain